MRKLIVNVWADGEGYGPGFDDRQPPAEVAEGLPARVWDEPPVSGADETSSGVREPSGAAAGDGDTGTQTGGDVSETSPVTQTPDTLDGLDGLDKDALLGAAAAEGAVVDRRWGAARLRAAIEEHRTGGG